MFKWERREWNQSAQQSKWEPNAPATHFPSSLADLCGPEELAKLVALRTRIVSGCLPAEFGLDECRVEFARWLVLHGKLTDAR